MTSRLRSRHLPALLWLLATTAHAEGGSLMPMRSTDVGLRSEAVELALSADEQAWHVRAHYELANDTTRARTLQLALPEYPCDEALGECTSASYADLETLVRGAAIKPRRTQSPSTKPDWAPAHSPLWLFDVQLAAGETVPIEQRYTVPASQSDDGAIGASYATGKGAAWAKPVEQASFTFVIPVRSCLVIEPENVTRRSRRVVLRDGAAWLQLVFGARNWAPRSAVTLHFETCIPARDTALDGCPLLDELARFAYPHAGAPEPEAPAAISGPELKARLATLDPVELEHCGDAVFRAYAMYFSPQELAVLARQPSAARHYTGPLLTEADWRWVGLVDEALRERAAQPPKPTAAVATHGDAGGCSSNGAAPAALGPSGTSYAFLLATFLVLAYRRSH